MGERVDNPNESLTELSDEDLADRARAGSQRCFAELYDRLGRRLYNFLLRRLRDGDVAEDITQEAFLRAWRSIDRFDRRWRFSTWLFTIGSRLASNYLRTSGRQINGLELSGALGENPHPSTAMVQAETRKRLWAVAERRLPPDQLDSLWLRYGEELPIADIARVLEKSEVAVRVLLFRARRSLAEELADREERPAHQSNGKVRQAEPAQRRRCADPVAET